jgi:hypothetical protein
MRDPKKGLAVASMIAALSLPLAPTVAWAQETEHGSGAGAGGQHTGGGQGQGQHAGGGQGQGQGKGPNPDCPYQDQSGRGGFGPGRAGNETAQSGADPAVSDTGVSGGGAGGERFVCDSPGNWHIGPKVLNR